MYIYIDRSNEPPATHQFTIFDKRSTEERRWFPVLKIREAEIRDFHTHLITVLGYSAVLFPPRVEVSLERGWQIGKPPLFGPKISILRSAAQSTGFGFAKLVCPAVTVVFIS